MRSFSMNRDFSQCIQKPVATWDSEPNSINGCKIVVWKNYEQDRWDWMAIFRIDQEITDHSGFAESQEGAYDTAMRLYADHT